ncbi:hypothetical protein AYO43_02510 [Nitrospira sp. SCGC AG-212-E16]|nr:hypothetical protein AYO43_02510 [Nitrospira sp. SCGC AG-212-E16]
MGIILVGSWLVNGIRKLSATSNAGEKNSEYWFPHNAYRKADRKPADGLTRVSVAEAPNLLLTVPY